MRVPNEVLAKSFNSATAIQPWRPPPVPSPRPSMRGLQFGHGHSAVETSIAVNVQPIHYLASIRPRPFSRGDRERDIGDAIVIHYASIRPRPFSRGDRNQLRRPARIDAASIRPRPFSRGDRSEYRRTKATPGGLQFGHGHSAVETTSAHSARRVSMRASIRPRPFSRGDIRAGRRS